ncbi:hypothetical protein HY090_02025 [Candidatus Kaiserbacteria bacterium]|nr:hypothetical protein [Candidatus Kaiserbacteria bacterium]
MNQKQLAGSIVGGAALLALLIIAPRILPHRPSVATREELVAIEATIPTQAGKTNFEAQSNTLTQSVDPLLVDLDSQIVTCSPNLDSLLSAHPVAGGSCVAKETALATTTGMYLGGQCCGPMKDLAEYHTELQNLQKYKDIPDVPMNPYKTPIPLATKWIDYDYATTLTIDEQKTMDDAMKLSKEGPCCCKCWHYYVNEGIAKKMIKDYHYSAAHIAAYWDTSSIC